MARDHSTSGFEREASAIARAEALLAIGRASDALTIAETLVAANPDDPLLHTLVGDCLLDLGRWEEAEQSCTRALEFDPDHPTTAVLAVRCAQFGPTDVLWERVQRLQHIDATTFRSRYWTAIGAAKSGHETLALDVLQSIESDFSGSPEVLHAAAEVDIAIARGHRGRRAHIAAANAETLLGLDPLDPRAHRLRQRASEVNPSGTSRSRHARDQLRYAKQASAAGLTPPAGKLRRLTAEAVGPVGAGIVIVFIALGSIAVDGGVPWPVGTLGVAVIWTTAWLILQHRLRSVVALLPELGRVRFLRPIARSFRLTAAVSMAGAVLALAFLFPFDTDRAVSIGFSSVTAHTETRVVYDMITNRSTPPLSVPRIETVTVPEAPDPVGATRLLRYYAATSVVVFTMALTLMLHARSMTRPVRSTAQEGI